MLERESNLFRFVRGYHHLLVRDLDDARLCDVPAPGMNHAAWILGHLAIGNDFGLGTLGAAKVCPAEWMPRFGPGSRVLPDRAAYPSLGELVSTFDRGHAALLTAVAATPAARWDAPHGWPFLQQELPTVADALAHLMTTHAAAHLGQLSAWRRGLGLPGVLGF